MPGRPELFGGVNRPSIMLPNVSRWVDAVQLQIGWTQKMRAIGANRPHLFHL